MSVRHNGQKRPIAFASHVLSSTGRNYSATECEALACIWGAEKWHFYLYGHKFTLRTDQQALKTLLLAPGKGHKPLHLHRWADRLMQYDFDVRYELGQKIAMADSLSRMVSGSPAIDDMNQAITTVASIFGNTDIPVVISSDLIKYTQDDMQLQYVIRHVRVDWSEKAKLTSEMKPFHDVWHSLSLNDDNLLAQDSCVIVPVVLYQSVLQLAQEGHPGIVRMKQRYRASV